MKTNKNNNINIEDIDFLEEVKNCMFCQHSKDVGNEKFFCEKVKFTASEKQRYNFSEKCSHYEF